MSWAVGFQRPTGTSPAADEVAVEVDDVRLSQRARLVSIPAGAYRKAATDDFYRGRVRDLNVSMLVMFGSDPENDEYCTLYGKALKLA